MQAQRRRPFACELRDTDLQFRTTFQQTIFRAADTAAAGGGLIAYGPDPNDPFRRAADYLDRILKGAKPSDLPVQAPAKHKLIINLKALKPSASRYLRRCSPPPTR